MRAVLSLCSLAAFNAPATVRYVDVNSTNPTPPYASWTTAAVTIQGAVDAAVAGDQILVTNGVYQTGGKSFAGETNRVAVDKPLAIQSVNGPQFTVIHGRGMVRCVYLTNGTVLAGFTLTNGVASGGGGVGFDGFYSDAVVSNCVIVGNSAVYGGGAGSVLVVGGSNPVGGTLNNCTLSGNLATGGTFPPYSSGGAADNCKLNNCTLAGNSTSPGAGVFSARGGGACASILHNCILTGNSAVTGGGAAYSDLVNCTLTGNSAVELGGGAESCWLRNSIIYGNNARNLPNRFSDYDVSYCCTTPLPPNGPGNISNEPTFIDKVGGNLRLQSNSPCINSGLNAYAPAGPDLDGSPRIAGGTVDMGAYEFQSPASIISYAWLQQYGFPVDGSADHLDSDGDRMNNWQEWIAGTVPTNALSLLRLLEPAKNSSGVTVSWESVSDRTYFLERAANLGAQQPFSLLTSNIVGQPTTTSYTDTNAVGPGPFFYRVGVQR